MGGLPSKYFEQVAGDAAALRAAVRRMMDETLPNWRTIVRTPAQQVEQGGSRDFVLAQRAAKGDMEAFEELYKLHHRRVYGLCLRMTQNVAEAEDVTQDVFIVLYHKVGSYRGESQFTTWLHRLTVNQVLMRFRRKKARGEETPIEDAVWMHEDNGMSATTLIDRIALDRALARLPPGYRAAFILHDIEGYEHEDVARVLGCAIGTSKSQLHKARMKLRKLLKHRS